MHLHTFGTVKPSIAAICEFLKAFGQVLGISLLVHGAWLKSVTVSQHAFCIEHTSMTSRLETGAQAKFASKSCSAGKGKTHTYQYKHTDNFFYRYFPKNFCLLPVHLYPFCFSISLSLLAWWPMDCTFQPHLGKHLFLNTLFASSLFLS